MSPVEVVVVGAVLLASAFYVVRQLLRPFKRSEENGCGESCGCEADKRTGADR